MSAITDFAQSGMWDYKNIIVPAAVGIPLAVETVILANNIYQNSHVIRETLKTHFTSHKDENRQEAILRIAKNALILLSCLSLMVGAAYASIVLLPSAIAIPTALTSIFLIGNLFWYSRHIMDHFRIRNGEHPITARKRILKNILKVMAITAIAATAIALSIHFVVAPLVKREFPWQPALPLQTKGVVFAEYASIGVLNGAIACHKWKKGDKSNALYHLFVAVLSFIFPAYYWNRDMRLHHSFYGLLMMSTSSRPVRMLGGLVCFDSALYMLAPLRGYSSRGSGFHKYDFINTIADNPGLYTGTYTGSLILENVNTRCAT